MSDAAALRSGKGLGWADALMLLTSFLFGSSFPLAKPILPAMDPVFYTSSRYFLGALFLFAALGLRGDRLSLGGADRRLLLLCSVLFAMFQTNWAHTLSLTNASVGAIFMATSPLFGALLAHRAGHRLRPLGWFGIGLAFFGVFLVINNSLSALTITFGSLYANLLWLANALLFAFYVAKSPPLIAQLGPLRMFAWVLLIASLLISPLAVWNGLHMDWQAFPDLLWLNFLYTALVTGALASMLWNVGMVRLGITRTMIYMYLVPLFAIAIAVLFLGEAMTMARWLGALAVLCGIAMTRRAAS